MKFLYLICFFLCGFLFADGAKITAIKVQGNNRIENQTIVSYLPIKVGDEITVDCLDQSLKSLFATGYFHDVKVHRNASTVVVEVEENPIINKIAFEGNEKVKDDDFKKEIHLRPREVLSYAKIQAAQQRMLEIYRRLGRFSAKVNPKIIRLPENRVDLVFEIEEGPITFIRKINFVGNKNVSSEKLEKSMQSKVWRWYRFFANDDLYDPDRFLNDQQEIKRYYNNHGFPDMRITSAVSELSPDKTAYFLTFTIDEGKKYKFGQCVLNSEIKSVKIDLLKEHIKFENGDEFDNSLIDKTIKELTDALGVMGYAFIDIETDIKRDYDNCVADIHLNIKEGPRVYIESVEIKGNDRTRDYVIRREIKFHEGDAFNSKKIKDSEQALKDLQFFKEVSVHPEEGSSIDRAKLLVDLEEQRTGEINFGVGYSTLEGPFTSIGVKERNFRGTGQTIHSSAMLSKKTMGVDLGITDPGFLDKDLLGSATVSARQSKLSRSHRENTYGTELGLGYELSEMWTQYLDYEIRAEQIRGINGNASSILRSQSKNAILSEIGQTLNFGKLDSRATPTKGFMLSYASHFAGVGGTVKYLKHRWSGTFYRPLIAEDVIFKLFGEFGLMQKVGKTIRVVDSFNMGYTNFRGFDFQGIGPRDSRTGDPLNGTRMWRSTVEIKFPSGLPEEWKINMAVFNDFGALWQPGQKDSYTKDSKKMRAAGGGAIYWTSPFGPIGIIYSHPYKKEKFDQSKHFQFLFSNIF